MTRPKPILVDEAALRRLIEQLELGNPRRNEYISARWLNYVLWWDARASHAKRYYHGLRSAIVIAGAALPALIAARELSAPAALDLTLAIAAIATSVVVATCAGLEGVFAFGEVWRGKRAAAERLKIEGFRFFQLTGQYNQPNKSHAELYSLFAQEVEAQIEREIGDYIAVQQTAAEKAAAPRS